MKRIVAVTGLSGVGKTTFLAMLQARTPFQHLQAGSLIRIAREMQASETVAHDHLKNLNLDQNQMLLVEAFHRVRGRNTLAILDSHTIIERDNEFTLIPAGVFAGLKIEAMFALTERPEIIAARRAADSTRRRPQLPVQEISRRQDVATEHAKAVATALNIPFHEISSADLDRCQRLLFQADQGDG